MKFFTNLRQTLRAPARTTLYVLLLAILTAFFCLSLNLWRNSKTNLKLADETYKTIAVMELYADVDGRGSLLAQADEGYAGYLPTAVKGYDIAPIINAPGVLRYDLRTRYGAYVPEYLAIRPLSVTQNAYQIFNYDIIRFTVNTEEPVVLQNLNLTTLAIDILESAADAYIYQDNLEVMLNVVEMDTPQNAAAIRAVSGTGDISTDTVILRPGVEYIASVMSFNPTVGTALGRENRSVVSNIIIRHDLYGADKWIRYSMKVGETFMNWPAPDKPFALQLYEEIAGNSDLSRYFDEAKNAYHISARSFGVMATDNVLGVPAFHLGSIYMHEGRTFTQAEYDAGARVCMISDDLAQAQSWSVGDAIDMSLYEYDCFLNETYRWTELAPIYTSSAPDDFFDAAKYTIIGVYKQTPLPGVSTISESALSVPWNTIFVPKKSIQNAPADDTQPVSGALLTVWLENGSVDEFLNEMDALGLTSQKSGDYEARFTFYDQGYSKVQPSLIALSGTAELLLILASCLLVCAAVLLAFFYALAQKQNLGVMRMLGCGKAKAALSVLLGALIIALVGVGCGAAAGHALTQRVGQSILAGAISEPEGHLAFSAFLAADQQIEIEFALGAHIQTTLWAFLGALGLFVLCMCGFMLRYLQKEPRALLPQSHE